MNKRVYFIFLIILICCMCLVLGGCRKPKNDFAYDEIDCKVKNGEYDLDGMFTIPKTKDLVPCIIIVAGSGPTNMDGTVNSQTPYKDIAKGLAEKGIATLRYNKVTYQYNAEVAKDIYFDLDDEYFASINSAIQLAKENKRIDSSKIYLLGHSLGSQMIVEVLASNAKLAGGIIMAGTSMHLLDIMLEQVKKQDEILYDQYKPYCEYVKGLDEVPVGEDKRFYFGAYTSYYVSYNKIDRNKVINVNQPLLIMQGKLDLQITIKHFDNYKHLLSGKKNVYFKEYELLNHLFTNGENETLENAYKKAEPVNLKVIEDIYDFIRV